MGTLDATGLTIETVESILTDIVTDQRSSDSLGPTIVTEAEEPLGQVNGIVAARLRDVYELAQVAYNAFNPAAVEGFLQDALGAITGTIRLRATYTTVIVDLDLDASVTIPSGAVLHIEDQPESRFSLVADVVSTAAGTYQGTFKADELGPIVVNAGTLTVIATPITGWNSATNPLDGETGRDEEKTQAFELRRVEELYRAGSATVGGIRTDVLDVDGVIQCIVLENVTEDWVDGIPPFSIEVVVFDGLTPAADDNEIAQAIFDSRAASTRTWGTTSGTAVDDIGGEHTIKFSRPVVKPVYLEFDLYTDDNYPGDVTFKEQIVTLGQTYLNTGDDVIDARLEAIAMGIAGIVDLDDIRLGFTASPVGTTNLPIATREIAELDTSRILVTIVG